MNKIETVKIDKLIPYWRNPRDNTKAIEKVKDSIREYGYQSLIVVDKKHTIIVGHSRYKALKELGYEDVVVVVSDMDSKKAKEYRIIDNRTSEYATWTDDLQLELKEFRDSGVTDLYFPDIRLDPDFKKLTDHITDEKIDQKNTQVLDQFGEIDDRRQNQPMLNITCPNCLTKVSMSKMEVNRLGNWDKE